MMIHLIYDDRFLDHDSGQNHPERPERLTAIRNALGLMEFQDDLNWVTPRKASMEEIKRAHSEFHIRNMKALADAGGDYADPDTYVSPESYETARLSAGAWLTAVDCVVDKKECAIVLSRPPGHHAERDAAMGFCLFSNAAIAAYYAIQDKSLSKAAIFDWDVHHGNGTQHILENDPTFAYCSVHQYPFYPGTGQPGDKGKFNNVLNIPLSAGAGGEEYRREFNHQVRPFLKNFNADILMISAGFDAAMADPLGGMNLEPDDFAWLLRSCLEIQQPLLIGLEGGYHLEVLGASIVKLIEEIRA